jgi:hypothetical protein
MKIEGAHRLRPARHHPDGDRLGSRRAGKNATRISFRVYMAPLDLDEGQ